MIISDSLPAYAVPSHADTWVGQRTDLITLATRSTITLVLTSSVAGNTITFFWGARSIKFTFVDTGMDNSGLKLYSIGASTIADWCTSTMIDLLRNADLTAIFKVERIVNDIKLTFLSYDTTAVSATTTASIAITTVQNVNPSGATKPNLTSLLRVTANSAILADYRTPYNFMTQWAYFNLRSAFRTVAPFVPGTAAFAYSASVIADLSTAVLPFSLSGADVYSDTTASLPHTERLTLHGDYMAVRSHGLPTAGTYARLLIPNYTRVVVPTQPNFVYILCDNDIAGVLVRAILTHKNGTTTTIDYGISGLQKGESYAFRSGLPQIYAGDAADIVSYTYTIYYNTTTLVQIGVVSYEVDQKCHTKVLTLLVETSQGGLETLALCGKDTPSLTIAKEEAQLMRDQTWTSQSGDMSEFGKQARDEHRLITRLVREAEYPIYEALLEGELWLINSGNTLEKVNLGNTKFDFSIRNQAFDISLKSAIINEI